MPHFCRADPRLRTFLPCDDLRWTGLGPTGGSPASVHFLRRQRCTRRVFPPGAIAGQQPGLPPPRCPPIRAEAGMVEPMKLATEGVAATQFEIPGSRGDFRIQILNEDASRGVVTSIVHIPAG